MFSFAIIKQILNIHIHVHLVHLAVSIVDSVQLLGKDSNTDSPHALKDSDLSCDYRFVHLPLSVIQHIADLLIRGTSDPCELLKKAIVFFAEYTV